MQKSETVPPKVDPRELVGNRFLRVFHPEKGGPRATIQDIAPGSVVEASDRHYVVQPSGALRVVGKPQGAKKQRAKARRERKAGV